MWPFYLGMRCHETGFMRDRPQDVEFHWLIVGEKVWSDAEERAATEERFGKVTTEVPLREPRDEDNYRLWGTTPNR